MSDSVTFGDKRADVFKVGEKSLQTIRYHSYAGEPPNTNQYTGLAVEQQGCNITLSCPCEVFGNRTYRMSLEESGDFVYIMEITFDYDGKAKYYPLGRFCRMRRKP